MVAIRHERPSDIAAREVLLDQCFGAARFAKASERLREGRLPAEGLSFVATDRGRLAGTVRLWHVSAGIGRPALLLGPLAVRPDCRGCGIGAALMARAIAEARARGHKEILLVGDEPYYARFGFSAAATGALSLPGPFERHRLLSLSLAGERGEAAGLVRATGARAPRLAGPPPQGATVTRRLISSVIYPERFSPRLTPTRTSKHRPRVLDCPSNRAMTSTGVSESEALDRSRFE